MKKLATTIAMITVLIFLAIPAFAWSGDRSSDRSKGYYDSKCHWREYCFGYEPQTVVKTRQGRYEGCLDDETDTLVWKGIPFARPPVGWLRWKRPFRPARFYGIRQADEFCEPCTQYIEDSPDSRNYVPFENEDCLYLNIWRPDSEETDLPVYFWIHGGGHSVGAASLPSYDGANLSNKGNLIVVSTNYRLGPLGWFTHPALRMGRRYTAKSDSGNYGTLDIIRALKWVRNNIRAFGGDPDNVTIAGESAGAMNVISLLISPVAAGLFHRAIAQSGPMLESLPVEAGDARANEVIDQLLVNDGTAVDLDKAAEYRENMRDCQIRRYLKSKTAGEILSVYTPWAFGMLGGFESDEFPFMFKDGTVIHEAGYPAAIESGDYNQVPIILGSTKEENKMFMLDVLYGPPPYVFDPPQMNPCEYQVTAEYWNDIFWEMWSVDNVANYLTEHQPGDVYAFQFLYGAYNYEYSTPDPFNPDCNVITSGFNAWPDFSPSGPNFALWFGASHSLDIPFFFGNYFFLNEDLTGLIFNQAYTGWWDLSDAMIDYVAQFARTGDPGDAGGEGWEPWSDPTGPRILLNATDTERDIEMSTP